ncbi:MAG: metallopeptidase TldD-related protein [Acidobacteriota bacterium]
MISDIVKEGIIKGFPSVEVSDERKMKGEYSKEGERISIHNLQLQEIYCRAMRDYGDPVTFALSGPGKRSVANAFSQISRSFSSSGKENFRKRIPKKADKVKVEIYDPSFDERGENDFRELSDKLDETVLNFPGLKINKTVFTKLSRKFHLMNSRGFNAKFRKTIFSVSLNMSLNGGSLDLSESRVFFKDLEPFKLVSRGYTLLDSLTDNAPVLKRFNDLVLSPESSSVILKIFSRFFLPSNNQKAGRVTYPTVLNVVDEPHLNFGAGSVPFDDEGVQNRKTIIINKGSFRSSVTDLRSSHIYNMRQTGNGFRRGGDHPAPGFTNLYIKPSVISVNNILRDISETILISLIKLISSSNGNFLFSAYGYNYRDGERAEPVHFFINTTFQDFFLNIVKISKEIRFFYSGFNTGSPYLLVKGKKTGDKVVSI